MSIFQTTPLGHILTGFLSQCQTMRMTVDAENHLQIVLGLMSKPCPYPASQYLQLILNTRLIESLVAVAEWHVLSIGSS
jgi:hypothetical protein